MSSGGKPCNVFLISGTRSVFIVWSAAMGPLGSHQGTPSSLCVSSLFTVPPAEDLHRIPSDPAHCKHSLAETDSCEVWPRETIICNHGGSISYSTCKTHAHDRILTLVASTAIHLLRAFVLRAPHAHDTTAIVSVLNWWAGLSGR